MLIRSHQTVSTRITLRPVLRLTLSLALRLTLSLALRLTLFLAGLSLLAGCGFHLRGNIDLPAELARVYVSGQDRDLVAQLSEALEQNGAKIVPSGHAAALIDTVLIDLGTSHPQRQTLTTDSRGRATAYALHYEVVFSVTGSDGEPLQATQSISLERAFDYDPTRQLQAEQEERFLETQMQREAVARILQRLRRI